MRHPHAAHISEVERRLTCCPVAGDVELRNRNAERLEGLNLEQGRGGVFHEALRQILAPLATDVVRDDNIGNAGFDVLCES